LRTLITRKLKTDGFDVVEAIDGNEAIKKSQEEKVHIILLDLILPGIDGFEVLHRLKENPSTINVPVIILSNLGQKDDIDRGIELGAKDFLIKAHFTPEEIIEKIKVILSQVYGNNA
jgi:DNA-binding response OmpR family regulator